MRRPEKLQWTGNDAADRLIAQDPLALLIGFCLDQQVPVQKAFNGPLAIKQRLGTLDAGKLANTDPGKLEAAFTKTPAIHRFPSTMAHRVQALCALVDREYAGDAARLWTEAKDGEDLLRRFAALPGYGAGKAASCVAVVANHFGVKPPGWEKVAPKHPTLGDVATAEELRQYQAAKRAHKAAMREASARGQR